MENLDTTIYINKIEIVLFLLTFIIVFLMVLKTIKFIKVKKAIFLCVLLTPALYLSVEGTTQFLTYDSSYLINEIVEIDISGLSYGFIPGSYRTSVAMVGTLLNVVKKQGEYIFGSELSATKIRMLAKAIHWFICMLVIIAIYYLIDIHYIHFEQKTYYFFVYFYSTLLLPSNTFGIKIINYDSFSLVFGTLALILVLISFKTQKTSFAIVGIIAATLAAQEKLIAGPVLLFAMFTYTYVRIRQINFRKISLKPYILVVYAPSFAIFISFLTVLLSAFLVSLFAQYYQIIPFNFCEIMRFTLLALVYLSGGDCTYRLFSLLIILISSAIIFLIVSNRLKPILQRQLRIVGIIILLVLSTAFVIGLTIPNFVTLGSHLTGVPFTGEEYISFDFNSQRNYYKDVKTYQGYSLAHIGYAYRTFIIFIPTVYLLVIPLLIGWHIRYNGKISLEWEIALLGVLLIPIAYGIKHVPLAGGGRYFNIFLFVMSLAVGLKMLQAITSNQSLFKKRLLTTLFSLIITLEVLPSRPIFASFNHFWRGNATWDGWGEEYFIAGKQLEKLIADRKIQVTGDVYLHYFYRGAWLKDYESVVKVTRDVDGIPLAGLRGCTDNVDYYVVRRSNLHDIEFMKQIEPLITISQWGYAYAWVYEEEQVKREFSKENLEKLFFGYCK